VRGSSVVSGSQAMKKAREVSQLVDELGRAGIPAEKIHLQGVHIETAGGGLLKSSSAVYRLRARCDDLDKIPGLLDILGSQKNAILDHIEWKYPEDEGRERALETALSKAKANDEKVSAGLEVRVLAVYDFIENDIDEEPRAAYAERAFMLKAERAAPEEPSLDMDIQHGKMIHVNVEIWYRVSGFENP